MKNIFIILITLSISIVFLEGSSNFELQENKNIIFLKKDNIEYEVLIKNNVIERIDFLNIPLKTKWENDETILHFNVRINPIYSEKKSNIRYLIDIINLKNKNIYIEYIFFEGIGYQLDNEYYYNQIELIINNSISDIFYYLYKIKALN